MFNRIISSICGMFPNAKLHDKDLVRAVEKLVIELESEGTSLTLVLLAIECAVSRDGVILGFDKLNNYLRYLFRIAPNEEKFAKVQTALMTLGTSDKFAGHLKSAFSLKEAILN